MKKRFIIMLAILAAVICGSTFKAQAAVQEFALSNIQHPTQGNALLFMQGEFFGHHFSENGVKLKINTDPAEGLKAEIEGKVIHQESGEQWSLSGRFANFRFQPGHPAVPTPFDPDSVPYDGMFDDWIDTEDRSARLFYDTLRLQLTPDLPGSSFNSGHAMFLSGKMDPNGDQLVWNYRRFTNPGNPTGDVFGATAWFHESYDLSQTLAADIHFNATLVGPNTIPEPGTMGLMSLGLSGIGFFQRKRKK